MPKSQSTKPGPRMDLKPAVPKRGWVTWAKARGSKKATFRPTLPNFSTEAFTWSARCVEFGIAREVAEEEVEKGVPLQTPHSWLLRQPPRNAAQAPPAAAVLPFPNDLSRIWEA